MVRTGLPQRLFVTACALSGTTNLATRRFGAKPFLPKLFVLRYANMGGLDPAEFEGQIDAVRSFRDDRWSDHWNRIAAEYVAESEALIHDLAQPAGQRPAELTGSAPFSDSDVATLTSLITPAAALFADHGPQPHCTDIARIVGTSPQNGDGERIAKAFRVIDSLTKAITYYQVSAFPGHSPHRMEAYRRSQRLFELLIRALAPAIEVRVERYDIACADEDTVRGWLVVPTGEGPYPAVLTTNGLEGTVAELAFGLLRYRNTGMATFMMEMPGSYDYTDPMGPHSEVIYRRVIDRLSSDPRLDPRRLAMVGVSFGGYWSVRMAATDTRLACAVACGAPTHRSFHGGLGMPDVIINALADTLDARNPVQLLRALRALSIKDLYSHITIPLLVINGDRDTLLSTQDSVDIADAAPHATLLLYPDDDHCAMRHYREWLDHSQHWLRTTLTTDVGPQPGNP